MARPLRVLIVEDNPDDADLVVRELKRSGFAPAAKRVDSAEGMREALAAEAWDIVISDFSMPGFSGADAIRVLQSSGRDLPFILVSGTVGEETAVEAMKAGASDYVLKDRLARLGPAVKREVQEAENVRRHREAEHAANTERKRAEDQVLRQLEALTALFAGAQKLTQSLDLQTLASGVTRSVVDVFGAKLAWIGQAQPDGLVRMLAVYPAQDERSLDQMEVRWDDSPRGQGTAGRAIRSGFPVVVADAASDPNLTPWRGLIAALVIKGVASFPLTRRDRPFGALVVTSDRADYFTPERVELIQAYANQAAAALENARLFAETERRVQQLGALRAIDLAITGSLDLRVTLNVLLDQATSQLQV
ncbi:MAG: GAF domain-containing protein, partial [bacterium]